MSKLNRTTLRCETLEAREVPAFLTPVTSPVHFGQTGDFNGDGKADLMSLDATAKTVEVRLGNGDGTFSSAKTTSTSANPFLLTVADLNADGKADLVIQQVSGNKTALSVFLSKGDGTFAVGMKLAPLPKLSDGTTQTIRQVAAADINLDGKPDLAVIGSRTRTVSRGRVIITDAYVNMFLGNGSGGFTAPSSAVTLGSETGYNVPFPVKVADFTGDGRPDVAAFTDRFTHMLMNQPDGSFVRKQSAAAGSGGSVAVADFNGDGKFDLVRGSTGGNTIAVYLSNGDGTFGSAQTFTAAPGVGTIAVADVNGDGKADVVTANSQTTGGDSISVLLGNGDGTFQPAQSYAVGAELISIALDDFDGDGRIDLARREWNGTAYQTSILFNDGVW